MENRHALVVDTRLTLATGTGEREAALEMVTNRRSAIDGRTTRHPGLCSQWTDAQTY